MCTSRPLLKAAKSQSFSDTTASCTAPPQVTSACFRFPGLKAALQPVIRLKENQKEARREFVFFFFFFCQLLERY